MTYILRLYFFRSDMTLSFSSTGSEEVGPGGGQSPSVSSPAARIPADAARKSSELRALSKDYWSRTDEMAAAGVSVPPLDWTLPKEREKLSREERKMQQLMAQFSRMEEKLKKKEGRSMSSESGGLPGPVGDQRRSTGGGGRGRRPSGQAGKTAATARKKTSGAGVKRPRKSQILTVKMPESGELSFSMERQDGDASSTTDSDSDSDEVEVPVPSFAAPSAAPSSRPPTAPTTPAVAGETPGPSSFPNTKKVRSCLRLGKLFYVAQVLLPSKLAYLEGGILIYGFRMCTYLSVSEISRSELL